MSTPVEPARRPTVDPLVDPPHRPRVPTPVLIGLTIAVWAIAVGLLLAYMVAAAGPPPEPVPLR